jgi:hypothetical protein
MEPYRLLLSGKELAQFLDSSLNWTCDLEPFTLLQQQILQVLNALVVTTGPSHLPIHCKMKYLLLQG